MCKKCGSALLGILIVLVIGMMIYFLDIQAIFGPGRHLNPRQDDSKDHPWNLENLLVPDDQTVTVPHKGHLQLLEAVNLTASVQRNNAPRGSVSIAFGNDCRIVADWSCRYEHDKKTYQIQTQMKGNVVPSRVYSDADKNKDKTQLFFIGKGPYTQTTQKTDALPRTEQGTAYIIGWLSPDKSVQGTVTITTDQKWSAVYDFQATAEKPATVK